MDRNFLIAVFGHDTGYVYTYHGQHNDNSDITVEFCNAINDHGQDTSVTQTIENQWLFWSKILLENNSNFVLLHDLTTIIEPIIIPEPPPPPEIENQNPTGPTGGAE